MTAKEKAKELVEKHFWKAVQTREQAKRSAIIAVDEIISELTEQISPSIHGFRHDYWHQVKQEIEKQ